MTTPRTPPSIEFISFITSMMQTVLSAFDMLADFDERRLAGRRRAVERADHRRATRCGAGGRSGDVCWSMLASEDSVDRRFERLRRGLGMQHRIPAAPILGFRWTSISPDLEAELGKAGSVLTSSTIRSTSS